MKEYTDAFVVRFKQGERDIVRKKMQEAGIKNMTAFIRKMTIDGYVIKLDLGDLQEAIRLLRINANNLNQYTKRANETGSIYLEDIRELKKQQEQIYEAVGKILDKLTTI